MDCSIVYAPLALEDLDDIWNYLCIECENEPAAIKATNAIMERIDSLSKFPESGTPLDTKCIIHSPYRFIISNHYLAFYHIAHDCIYIDRVLDGRSNYLQKLFGINDSSVDFYSHKTR